MSNEIFGMSVNMDPALSDNAVQFVHPDGRVDTFNFGLVAQDTLSKEPQVPSPNSPTLEEGTVFEHDGDLYLVEKLEVRIAVTAQLIESRRAEIDALLEKGEPTDPTAATCTRFEGDRNHPIWREIKILVPHNASPLGFEVGEE